MGEHDAWIDLPQSLPVHAERIEHGVVAVRQEDVRRFDQPVRDGLTALLLEVDHDTLLVPPVEQEAVGDLRVRHPGQVLEVAVDVAPAGCLDLDHLSPEVREDRAGRRRHHDRRKFDDADSVQQRPVGLGAGSRGVGGADVGRKELVRQSGGIVT